MTQHVGKVSVGKLRSKSLKTEIQPFYISIINHHYILPVKKRFSYKEIQAKMT